MADEGPDPGDDGLPVDEEEESEIPLLKQDHPLLARVQRALLEQLTAQKDRLRLQLAEKQEELKKLVGHRENIGVTLYHAQQQLAKLQLNQEEIQDKFSTIVQSKEDENQKLESITGDYDRAKREVDQQLRQVNKAQDELNQLNTTLRQVEEYNEQMKGEIGITRRATYKAEDVIKKKEKVKKQQDLVIDKMNQEIRKLNDSKAVYEAQIVAQKAETAAALKTLQEAAKEIEAVAFEKNQLSLQWRSCLIGIQKRDEAAQEVMAATNAVEQRQSEIQNEIRGVQNSIREEQEQNEKLSTMQERNMKEVQFLQSQMTVVRAERERLAGHYSMLKKSLDHSEVETAHFETAIATCQNEIDILDQKVTRVTRQITETYNKIDLFVSDQVTSKRNEAGALKNIKKVAMEVTKKEDEAVKVKNDVAKTKMDTLNTRSKLSGLASRIKELEGDIEQRSKTIAGHELEIKQRHLQIEKKQLFVDRLNREYDDKKRRLEEELGEAVEASGPLEAKIKQLRKQIAERANACGFQQKEWLKRQHKILEEQQIADKLKQTISDVKQKKIILEQKKTRSDREVEVAMKEVKQLEASVKELKHDMDRMNAGMAKYDEQAAKLQNDAEVAEMEFVAKLKGIESSCTKMESHIEAIKMEKEQMAEETIEAEKQIMLWQRKIHLEQEMQQALDPSVGEVETTAMKKEIHRMSLRLDQLKRRQEQIITEMERTVQKRDVIQLKFEPKAKKGAKLDRKREVENLKRALKSATEARTSVEEQIAKKEKHLEELQTTVTDAQREAGKLEQMTSDLAANIAVTNIVTEINKTKLGTHREIKSVPPDAPAPEGELERETALREKLERLVGHFRERYPNLEIFHPQLWASFYEN
ncbi:unnamed protein product [Amoebophrya sp. A25]|nr:unnamed protein product [Amoebophrya sp. A25]|eukprot:GSA25T00000034001.1